MHMDMVIPNFMWDQEIFAKQCLKIRALTLKSYGEKQFFERRVPFHEHGHGTSYSQTAPNI